MKSRKFQSKIFLQAVTWWINNLVKNGNVQSQFGYLFTHLVLFICRKTFSSGQQSQQWAPPSRSTSISSLASTQVSLIARSHDHGVKHLPHGVDHHIVSWGQKPKWILHNCPSEYMYHQYVFHILDSCWGNKAQEKATKCDSQSWKHARIFYFNTVISRL